MRRPFLAGNWKMHGDAAQAQRLATSLRERLSGHNDRDVAVFPTYVSIAAVARILEDSSIRVGAQNCHPAAEGAFTGEVSAPILKSVGASMVLVGHSERRQGFGETDAGVAQKTAAALLHRLDPIVCVGETLAERDGGRTLEVIETQVRGALAALPKDAFARITLAYEPVWAIGTGRVATPEQAEAVHAHIRRLVREMAGPVSEDVRILYGGSVKPDNVDGLLACPNIDGALVGGASLDPASFERIVAFTPR